MKKFIFPSQMGEPRSGIPSAQFRFENKMIAVSPEEKRVKNWSVQRRLPAHIKSSVIQSRAETENRREMTQLLSNHPSNENKFVFLVVSILGKSYSPIGFSKLFDNKIEVFEFAKSIGREKVKIGKKVYDVALELQNEAARLERAKESKDYYIKFGYWKQGD